MKSTLPVPSGLTRPTTGFKTSRRFSLDEEEQIVRAMLARLDCCAGDDPYEGPGSKSPPTLPGSRMTAARTTLLSAK